MPNKFNMEFLKSETQKGMPNLDSFKTPTEMFGKANSEIDMIPTDKLIPYEKHPFKIRDGERLDELTESIKEQGVLVPLIVRVHPTVVSCYEILAGHHRHAVAMRAGITELPCIIKNADDNVTALIVVESNKQRGFADMLPSEIAKALKLEYDALKCQGKRTDLMAQIDEIFNEKNAMNADDNEVDLTSCPLGTKSDSAIVIGDKNSISRRDTFRYIRLTSLTAPLQEAVDKGEIAVRPAVDLSYLTETEQELVLNSLADGYKVDMKKAEKLKEYSQSVKLNEDSVMLIMSGVIFGTKPKKVTSVKLSVKRLKSYIPAAVATEEYEQYVIDALEFYNENK